MLQKEISKTKDKVILIVDDSRDNIDLVEEILSEAGYENILMARSGSKALAVIDEKKPDLIILDIMMPDISGYEVCKALHQNEKTSDIPIIMVTAKTSVMDLKKGFEVGAFDYIKKPYEEAELIVRVQSALILKQSKDELKKKNFELLTLTQQNQKTIKELDKEILEHKRLEKALMESEEKFRKIYENVNDEIIYLDKHGNIVDVNSKIEDIFGYTPREVIGKNLFSLALFENKEILKFFKLFLDIVRSNDGGSGQKAPLLELNLIDKNKNKVIVEVNSRVIETDGKIEGVLCVTRDVTERKQIEEKLRKSEQRNRLLFETSVDPIFLVDKRIRILRVNKRFEEVLGYSKKEVTGKSILELGLIAPKSAKIAGKNFLKKLQGDYSPPYEIHIVAKDGNIIPFELNSSTFVEGGKVAGELISIRDIRWRKEAEKAIKAEQEKYQNVVENIEEGLFSLDEKGFFTYVNQGAAERISGYTSDEVIGMHFTKLLSKEKLPNALPKFQSISKGESVHNIETKLRKKDGTLIHVCVSASPKTEDGKLTGIFGVISDISERKKMVKELQESEERYSAIVEGSNDGIVIMKGSKIVFANQNAADMSGYTIDEVYGQDFIKFVAEEHVEKVEKRYDSRMGRQDISQSIDVEIIHKNGNSVPVEVSGTLIEYQGELSDVVFLHDISDRKKMEKELRESEERYSTIVEESNDAIVIFKGFKVVFANKKASELSGYPLEAVGSNALRFVKFDPNRLKEMFDIYRRRLVGEDDVPSTTEIDIRNKDGHIIPAEASIAKIEYEGGPAEVIFMRDITERKQAEKEIKKTLEELKRSNEELEQFAYVASHDLQEPLRMISSYVQLLSRKYKGKLDSDADDFIFFAVDGAKRMQKMIQDLLTYSRVGTHGRPFEPTECETVLNHALTHLALRIEESGTQVTHEKMPDVIADEVQLTQLFQNLIANAIKYNDKDTPKIQVLVHKEGDEWLFSVKDNGIGIDSEYKDQVFQIFRRLPTDKEYEGSGIGLSVCRKIVERHGGRIWLESKPGEGTTFYFTIPIREVKTEEVLQAA